MTPPTTGIIEIEQGGDENITINHGCSGGICGGGSNSSGDDSGDGGDDGGIESDGGVGCGRADDDGDNEDDDGGYGGGKTRGKRQVVAAAVKHQVAAVAAVGAVDGEDGVQWREKAPSSGAHLGLFGGEKKSPQNKNFDDYDTQTI